MPYLYYMSSAYKNIASLHLRRFLHPQKSGAGREGRRELIEGIPYAMSPAPAPKHQWVSNNLKSEFRVEIKNKGCKNCKVYDFLDVKYSEDTVFEPDGLVVCHDITKKFIDFPPKLVFEVLSPSTALKDIHTKSSFYEKFGILYYLIVDSDKETVQIFQLINNQYQEINFNPGLPNIWE